MKTHLTPLIPLSLLIFMLSPAFADDTPTVDALLDIVANPQSIPYADRQEAKKALIARSYDEVLPKLAPRPVIPIKDAVRVELEAIAWRDALKRK